MSELSLGSPERPLRVAVIGSGPSAFYAVEALFKTEQLDCRVDMFERLPTPFGLVRGGVAPDHQKIKTVMRIYEGVAADPRFRLFGNVTLGRDVSVEQLAPHYDRFIYAVGNEGERRLGIPGEGLAGVHSATSFVGWYNGHPDHAGHHFDLPRARRAVVVGNGNVAIDVTRVLLRNPDELFPTDIAGHALDALRGSGVTEVVLLGRRGPAQSAFSPKEIKEIDKLPDVEVRVDPREMEIEPDSQRWLDEHAPRSAHKNVEFLKGCAERGPGDAPRFVRCAFRGSPVEVLADDQGRVRGVRVERNELHPDDQGTPRPRGTGEFHEIEAELVFYAVGYRGVPVPGVPFCERWGVIPNAAGRVQVEARGELLPGHYVVGWAKRGPSGLIGTNSPDSKDTVAALVEDLTGATAPALPGGGDLGAVPALLHELGVAFVDYADWERYDAWERATGEAKGRVREKLTDVAAILARMQELRGAGT